MASSARIDELRKKFDENPRRYFAPLANEYRKIGDFDQAIFICQEYLPQQPGHMSGHIVYGQALFEIGRPDEARTVFETALTLDPENLIALRHLGDIASASGDVDAARAWYQRVLDADPRNEEIAALLGALRSQAEPEPPAPPSQSAQPPGPSPAASRHTPAFSWGDAPEEPVLSSGTETWDGGPLVVEHASEAPSSSEPGFAGQQPAEPPSDPDHELFDISDFNVGERVFSAPAESADLGGTDETEADGARAEALFEADPLAITRASEATPVSAPAVGEIEQPLEAEHRADGISDVADPREMASAVLPGDHAVSETPFVTETMAELYVSQGHRHEAVEIYRELVQRRPAEPVLRERLAALEESETPGRGTRSSGRAAPSGPSIRTFLRQALWEWNAPIASPNVSPTAEPVAQPALSAASGAPGRVSSGSAVGAAFPGESLDDLFPQGVRATGDEARAALLADGYRVDESAGRPLRGVPAHRATGELSLDHVFGSQGSADRATPSVRSANGEKFFEQFFAGDASGASEHPASHTRGAESSPDEDIEQFNAWLQGLKQT